MPLSKTMLPPQSVQKIEQSSKDFQ